MYMGPGADRPPGTSRMGQWSLGTPAPWAATSNVEGESGIGEGPLASEAGLSSDKFFAGARVPS